METPADSPHGGRCLTVTRVGCLRLDVVVQVLHRVRPRRLRPPDLGWSIATTMTSQFVVDANEQSIRTRKRDGKDLTSLITHHDHRSQYLSVANTKHLDAAHLDAAKIKASTGAVGSSYEQCLRRVDQRAL